MYRSIYMPLMSESFGVYYMTICNKKKKDIYDSWLIHTLLIAYGK